MSSKGVLDVVRSHPRLMDALFVACVLLTSAGNVIAGGGGGSSGP